jgi:hypothetical protein
VVKDISGDARGDHEYRPEEHGLMPKDQKGTGLVGCVVHRVFYNF